MKLISSLRIEGDDRLRTIAERLAYNRRYTSRLNPILFDDDGIMKDIIRKKLQGIADAFLEYIQVEIKVLDVRLVGSNASYNYNEHSDIDIHIVTDLSKISDPETIARLYFDSVKKNFKDSYDIKIKGIDVELYVEDVNTSANSNGIYSLTKNSWIKEPSEMEDPTESELSRAEQIEENILDSIENVDSKEQLEDILDNIYLMRKDSIASEGETGAGNLAFKSLRNKGILDKIKEVLRDKESKELSLEGKKIREGHQIPKGGTQYTINCTDDEGSLQKILDAIKFLGDSGHSCDIIIDPGEKEQKFYYDGDGSDKIQTIFKDDSKDS